MTKHAGGGPLSPVTQPNAESSSGRPAAMSEPCGQLSSRQSYNAIFSCDNSRIHAGNVYNSHYHLTPAQISQPKGPSDEERRLVRTFLRCLDFKESSSRQAGIATAHPDTCRWVVDCLEYKRWRSPDIMAEHHGCIWMKGKPGAGKSTIMKGLLRHAKGAYANDKVVSFFFNARGMPLERSTEGMYRSLHSERFAFAVDGSRCGDHGTLCKAGMAT
jgi:hypothetical protein